MTMLKTVQGINSMETSSDKACCIHDDEVLSWRKSLKIDDGKRILIALAWCHSSNQRNIHMFPEVLSVDVAFGVCREQRNLLRF